MKKKRSFWDVLAWVALGFILVWIILKMLGLISTPLWLEYSPLLAAVYIAGWQMHKLETVAKDVDNLKKFKFATIEKIHNIENNCIRNHGGGK